MLKRDYRFKNFAEAMAFAVRVGGVAEEQQQHPDLHVAWGKVGVDIWTHKIGGLTESDVVFAAKCDALYSAASPLAGCEPNELHHRGERHAKLATSVCQSRAGNRRIRGGVRRVEHDLAALASDTGRPQTRQHIDRFVDRAADAAGCAHARADGTSHSRN
jgi:pterin-4a-carbinolamine dehydratase